MFEGLSVASGGDTAQADSGGEKVFPNIKFRPKMLPVAVASWLVIYFVPGLLIGFYAQGWVGLVWMLAGAAPLASFSWHCLFPQRLVVGRDGFRLERPDRKRGKVDVSVGFGKIHEARWERREVFWRRLVGPLVFIEPLWPAQRRGRMQLVVSHAGPHVTIREDEIARLEEFVDILRARNILGLSSRKAPQPPSFFAQN